MVRFVVYVAVPSGDGKGLYRVQLTADCLSSALKVASAEAATLFDNFTLTAFKLIQGG